MGSVYGKSSVKNGQWYVELIGEYWYIRKKGTSQKKKIGKIRSRGTNYFDEACSVAIARNKAMK